MLEILKHGFSKRLAAVNCNFRNIPKSVACKHQVMQCAVWNANEGLKGIECNGNLSLDTLEGAETVRNSLGIDEDADCFVADWVTVFGTEYRPSMFLITAMENDMPQFCKICSILINGKSAENVRFVLKTVKTTGYSHHYHAYSVSTIQRAVYSVITFEELNIEHPPLSQLRACGDSSVMYMSLRHIIKMQHWYVFHNKF